MLPPAFLVYITLLDFTFLWDTVQNPTVIYTKFWIVSKIRFFAM